MSEYHWFHREKVELFMAELYNKIGKNTLHLEHNHVNEYIAFEFSRAFSKINSTRFLTLV